METCGSRFTAAEGGARLAAVVSMKNTIITEHCSFVTTRLLYEDAYKIRGLLSEGRQRSIYLTRASRIAYVAYELSILTDLAIGQSVKYEDIDDWSAQLEEKEVIVCTSNTLQRVLREGLLSIPVINVLVIDSCHLISIDEDLKYVMNLYKQCEESSRPRLLALTYPLFTSVSNDNEQLENVVKNNEEGEDKSDVEDDKISDTNIVNADQVIDKNETIENVNENKELVDENNETVVSAENSMVVIKNKEYSIGDYQNVDDFEMYEKLGWKIEELENDLNCEMDLAEDIDGGKRLSATIAKPKEVIIEFGKQLSLDNLPDLYKELDQYMRDTIRDAMDFINEHRYDPMEIYGEELFEEFMNIPDPTREPKELFYQFLYILDELGPYAADKAAFYLLTKLEKLKVKVPYERHFLLLCMCTSLLIKIRAFADNIFSQFNDWEKIQTFCTPKLLRFAEILEQFRPTESNKIDENRVDSSENAIDSAKSEINTSKTTNMLKAINDCDFITLGNKIEDRVNTYEANLKELENVPDECGNTVDSCGNKSDSSLRIVEISSNSNSEVKKDDSKLYNDTNKVDSWQSGTKPDRNISIMRGTRHRVRGRGRVPRNNPVRIQQAQQNPDALCGIVFVKEPLMTKILFMLIVDMTRSKPSLNHVSAQYCADETTGSELKECQRQSRKQEDVLKKFRMHECNLLLATPALEEGIDLPRCNLVVRWDVPPSYRSHSLCRGRARAPRSALALLAEAPEYSKLLLHHLAIYRELDQIISRKCGCGIQDEPPPEEENHADDFTLVVKAYSPVETKAVTSLKDIEVNLAKNVSKKCLQELIKVICERKIINTETEDVKNIIKYLKESEPEVIEGNCKDKIETNSSLDKSEEKKEKEDSVLINGKKNSEDSLSENEIKSFVDKIETIQESRNIKNDIITELVKQIDCIHIDSRNDSSKFQDNKDSVNDNSDKSESFKEIVENVNQCIESLSVDSSKDSVNCKTETGVKSSDSDCVVSVDLSTAIALINRYCGKLPSDTFTRLAPQWWMEEVLLPDRDGNMRKAFICTLRLPLNCPVKYNIVGHPMPTRVLARRMVALQACRILHKSGELDNQLMPIGKENFKAAELEGASNSVNNCANINGDATELNDSARPGTTKRRQYYFKRTAWAFTDCQPVIDASDSEIDSPDSVQRDAEPKQEVKSDAKRNTLYAIDSRLWCALPERYNTRGRRLHAPQHASQAIGILMARHQPDKLQIPAFPVYTRSGEVRVQVQLAPRADVRLSPRRARLVRRFMRFVFSDVLRVRRRGMKLQSEGSTHNNYYVVPTIKTTKEDGTTMVDVDWGFLELIYKYTEEKKSLEVEKPLLFQQDEEEDDEPLEDKMLERAKGKDKDGKVKKMENPLLKPGETFVFDPEKYKEAVVTPWYRNQDQPQFFLVAEICWNLTPDSAFPSATHTTFRDYYSTKYGVELTQPNQPLLDVDHTSARLNLLTPRYVNRKGVALPVSSERTRRAKRDRLDQKQILLPELCRVHPFAAPLWFATVALPCVLYRINALLIADEIRRAVAIDVGLGIPKIDESTCPGFQWPPLDFGWSLAEVLSADSEKNEKKKDEEDPSIREQKERELREKEENERIAREQEEQNKKETEKTINDILQEKEDAASGFEIGTWSNDMASSIPETVEFDDYLEPLPPNLTFCTSASGGGNWSDPIEKPKMQYGGSRTFSMADSDCSYMSSDFDTDDSDLNSEGSDEDTDTSGFCSSKNSNAAMGVRIEYKTAREAEAVDLERVQSAPAAPQPSREEDERDRAQHRAALRAAAPPPLYIEQFRESVTKHKKEIVDKGFLLDKDKPITELLPEASRDCIEKLNAQTKPAVNLKEVEEIFPYGSEELSYSDGQITIESIEKNKRLILSKLKESLPKEDIKRMNCFSMKDVDIDSPDYVNEKVVNVGFDTKDSYKEKIEQWDSKREFKPYYQEGRVQNGKEFDFDYQPDLEGHPGPSPSVILQALTMSNANDGINLERLETIGDSFLKFAITAYLYCAHPTVHEGKLSHMRSKQVSNLNLYRLGVRRRLGARMTASKFEPHDNWLPPCHRAPHAPQAPPRQPSETQEQPAIGDGPVDSAGCFIPYNLITQHSIPDKSIADCVEALIGAYLLECGPRGALLFMSWLGIRVLPRHDLPLPENHPYVVAHKNDRDDAPAPVVEKCPSPHLPKREPRDSDSDWSEEEEEDEEEEVEEQCGPQELGPEEEWGWPGRPVGSLKPYLRSGTWYQPIFGALKAPPSPLLRYIEDPEGELEQMLSGYEALERTLQYRFADRALLLQALTHASHQRNRLTDCYQRLEFLGDAILGNITLTF
ncbi:unnamed protein product [Parnassius mnemosyne]|uniref:Uncharacterized protein n=1 Tax=Parnassius mnemosyne TaxID=213953 RepID=A0AAV1LDL3_9NEOP